MKPFSEIPIVARRTDGSEINFNAIVRLETPVEVEYYKNGGILQTVVRNLAKK